MMPVNVRLLCVLTVLALSIVPGAMAFAPAPTKKGEGDPLPKGAWARLGSVRLRHGTRVKSLCFSPDGATIFASGGGSNDVDNAVYLWDAADGKRKLRVPIDSGDAAAAYSPDGKRVAVACWFEKSDRGVIVLDATTGKELHRLETLGGVGCLCFCPKGKRLAILAGGESEARDDLLLWEPGQKPRRFERPPGWGTVMAFSPDGKLIAARCAFSTSIYVWDAATGKQKHLLQGHEDAVLALAFTSDSRRLVSAGQGQKNAVRIWDLGTGKELPALPDRKGEVQAMWLSADDKTLLVVDGEARLRGWHLPEGKRLTRLPKLDAPAGYSVVAAFSLDGKRLAMGSPGRCNVIALWDLATGGRILRQIGHEAPVLDLAFSADGKRLASCASDGAILWDLGDRRPMRRFGSTERAPTALALSPDGALLALSEDGEQRIRLIDTARGKEFSAITWSLKRERDRYRFERDVVEWMRFSPDGRSLAAAMDGKALLWHLSTGWEAKGDPHVLHGEGRQFWPGGFSRDGKRFFAGTEKGVIGWDARNGKETSRTGEKIRADFSAAALSPDGKWLAFGGNSGRLTLWDTTNAREVASLLKNPNDWSKGFRAVAFSPDGKTLASGDRSGVIRFWDVTSRKELGRHEGHVGQVLSLAFSPDGKTLASGGSDTTVLLWPVPKRKE